MANGISPFQPVGVRPVDFQAVNAIWPGLLQQQAVIAPSRNGMNRFTGKMIQGWEHVEQSLEMIFETPYHVRVLRRWVGSFVPRILGESIVERIISRFFWAIATAIDLWEPGFRIMRTYFMGDALQRWAPLSLTSAAAIIRTGEVIFRTEGTWYPRGHLGDFTAFERRASNLISAGGQLWDVVPTATNNP